MEYTAEKTVSLKSLDNEGNATFKVANCSRKGHPKVEIKFIPSSQPTELTYAELAFSTPKEICYVAAFEDVSFNLKTLLKEAAQKNGVKSNVVKMKALPYNLEIIQAD